MSTENIPKGFVIREPKDDWGTAEDTKLHIALVTPEIPGNTGNIGRLCAGCNISLHLIEPLGFELDNKRLRRAGLDYWPHVELYVHPSFEVFSKRFPEERLFLFSKKAERYYTDCEFKPGSVLVFGCETKGLSDEILQAYEKRTVTIPMTNNVRSLNLSNAAAVASYEALRQLTWTPILGE